MTAESAFWNRVKVSANASSGLFTVITAEHGFRTIAGASIPDGAVVSYVAQTSSLLEWETGQGTVGNSGTTLARTTIRESSNGNLEVSFGSPVTVAIDFQSQDITRPGVSVESFGASPLATAAANVTAIQAALDYGGILWLTRPGTYQINTELQIGNNTDLRLGPGVILQCVAANINMLSTKALHVSDSSVTLSWTSGTKLTVSWTTHGLSVGDAICIAGANQSYFNGVFLVETVTDANTVIVNTIRLPATSPTGTTVARKCNTRAWVRGGTWDRNYPTYDGGAQTGAHMMLGYLYDGGTQDVRFTNGRHYAINAGAMRAVSFINSTVHALFGDGIKVYGPAFDVRVKGLDGIANDDTVSFQTKEFDAFSTYRWTFGDVIGCSAEEICSSALETSGGGSVAACYISVDETMDEMHFSGLYGTRPASSSPLFFLNGQDSSNSTCDLVTISKVTGWSAGNPITFGKGKIRCAIVRDVNIVPYPTGPANTIYVNSSSVVNELIVDGISIPSYASWSGAHYMVQNDGQIDNLVVRGANAQSSSNAYILFSAASTTLKSVDVYGLNGNFGSGDIVTLGATISGTPKISFYGGRVTAADSLVYTKTTCLVGIFGVAIESVTSGVIITDTTNPTVTAHIAATRLDSGVWTASFSGSPVFKLTRLDSSGDIKMPAAGALSWDDGSGGTDLYLYREGADILAQRRSTHVQAFTQYATYTDASNYERFAIVAASGGPQFASQHAGTGSARDLQAIAGANSWTFRNSDGGLTLDVGADGFIGATGVSYLQFDKAGLCTFFDWASGAGGTFSGRSRTAAQITADKNNYNPGGYSFFQRWSSDAARNVTGLTFSTTQEDGEVHLIVNVGSQNIVLKHEATGSSTAANCFNSTTGADITLSASQMALVVYDTTSSRWRTSKLN